MTIENIPGSDLIIPRRDEKTVITKIFYIGECDVPRNRKSQS